MHSYHVTAIMADGSKGGQHCGLYPHGAAAALRAAGLFPNAAKLNVKRLATVLLCGARRPHGKEAA